MTNKNRGSKIYDADVEFVERAKRTQPVVHFDDMGRPASAEDRANYAAIMEVGQ